MALQQCEKCGEWHRACRHEHYQRVGRRCYEDEAADQPYTLSLIVTLVLGVLAGAAWPWLTPDWFIRDEQRAGVAIASIMSGVPALLAAMLLLVPVIKRWRRVRRIMAARLARARVVKR